jgi:hypothetical protein
MVEKVILHTYNSVLALSQFPIFGTLCIQNTLSLKNKLVP